MYMTNSRKKEEKRKTVNNAIKGVLTQRVGGCGFSKSPIIWKLLKCWPHNWPQTNHICPPLVASSHWLNNDEFDEIKTIYVSLSALRFWRVPLLWVQSTKQPFPWPTFPALCSTWKDQRTMKNTVLESLLQWEENKTTQQPGCHWKPITQWKQAVALAQPSFLLLSSVATKRDSPNVTSNSWLIQGE